MFFLGPSSTRIAKLEHCFFIFSFFQKHFKNTKMVTCTLLANEALALLRFLQSASRMADSTRLTIGSSGIGAEVHDGTCDTMKLWMRAELCGAIVPQGRIQPETSSAVVSIADVIAAVTLAHKCFSDVIFICAGSDTIHVNGRSLTTTDRAFHGTNAATEARLQTPFVCVVNARLFLAFASQLPKADVARADMWVALDASSPGRMRASFFASPTWPMLSLSSLSSPYPHLSTLSMSRIVDVGAGADKVSCVSYSAALLQFALECCCSENDRDASCSFTSGEALVARVTEPRAQYSIVLGSRADES